jgi:hypothetical protein
MLELNEAMGGLAGVNLRGELLVEKLGCVFCCRVAFSRHSTHFCAEVQMRRTAAGNPSRRLAEVAGVPEG